MPDEPRILTRLETTFWGGAGAFAPVFLALAPRISDDFDLSAGALVVAAGYVALGIVVALAFEHQSPIQALLCGTSFPAFFGFSMTQLPGL